MKYRVVISIEEEVEADSQQRAIEQVWYGATEGTANNLPSSSSARIVKADAMLQESAADAARRGFNP